MSYPWRRPRARASRVCCAGRAPQRPARQALRQRRFTFQSTQSRLWPVPRSGAVGSLPAAFEGAPTGYVESRGPYARVKGNADQVRRAAAWRPLVVVECDHHRAGHAAPIPQSHDHAWRDLCRHIRIPGPAELLAHDTVVLRQRVVSPRPTFMSPLRPRSESWQTRILAARSE